MHSPIWGCQHTFQKTCSVLVTFFKGIYEYAEPIYADTYEYAELTLAEEDDRNKDLWLSFKTEET